MIDGHRPQLRVEHYRRRHRPAHRHRAPGHRARRRGLRELVPRLREEPAAPRQPLPAARRAFSALIPKIKGPLVPAKQPHRELQRAGRLFRHERPTRPEGLSEPCLWYLRPEGSPETASLASVARVYPDALVRATMRLLQQRACLRLPDDIEPLVEAVYSAEMPATDDALYGAFLDYVGVRFMQRQDAEQRLWPRPDGDDDPFSALRCSFDDDEDPALHDQLRAITRSGPPSVEVYEAMQPRGYAVELRLPYALLPGYRPGLPLPLSVRVVDSDSRARPQVVATAETAPLSRPEELSRVQPAELLKRKLQ